MSDPTPQDDPSPPPPPGLEHDPRALSSAAERERALIAGALQQASPRPGSALFPLRPREIAKDAIAGYEILREIHRGGQGVVYQAIQKSTQRKVAIKVVHGGPFAGDRERARVEREVRILAGLDHPSIVKIHDSGVAGGVDSAGSFYYVMDYVSGNTLDAFIGKEPKPIDEVLKLFGEICDAVSAAHLKGVIHRDLKPSNIRIDNNGRPHILDFGLAKLSVPDQSDGDKPRIMTMTGQFVGSLPWASPEQAAGAPDKIDLRTDVYSLGVILYQLLTGKFPYQVVGQMRDVLEHILKTEPARPSTVRKQINDEVETIVLKCLAKEPERRYQSAGELARDIQRYLRGEPVEAKRDSGWYVVTKTLRRHRFAVAFAAAILVLLLAFAAAMALMWSRERALKTLAQDRLAETIAQREAKESARAQAQANFESVREMARVFMFDFSEGIEDLRGATLVREKLLTTAKAALAKLADSAKPAAPDAKPNPDLQRELADAYDRVGDIEAGLHLPRVGDTAAGAANYLKARQIREALLGSAPQSPLAHADIAESQRRAAKILQRQRKFAEAKDEFARALAGYDTALTLAQAAPPDAPRAQRFRERRFAILREGANLLVTTASEAAKTVDDASLLITDALGRYAQAESFWRDRLRADPRDRKAQTELGVAADQRARAFTTLARVLADASIKAVDQGRKDDALRLHEQALAQLAQARKATETSIGEFKQLSESRTQDAALRRDLLIALYNLGDTFMREGDILAKAAEKGLLPAAAADPAPAAARASAKASFERALDVAAELARADQGNLEARRDWALVLNKLGNVLRDLAELDRAAAVFQESLDIREDLWRTDPMQQHRADLAVGLYKRAELDRKRAEPAPPADRAALLESSRGFYARALDAYTALKDAGVDVRERDIDKVRSELEACEAELRKLKAEPQGR